MLLVSRQKGCFCLIFLGSEPGRWSGGLVSCTLGSVSATADSLKLADVFLPGKNAEINQRYIDQAIGKELGFVPKFVLIQRW